MAIRKIPYNWEKVEAGDIISFKYKTAATGRTKNHTIMVLNPSLITKGKKKTSTQLIGIKIEESNKLQLEITRKQIVIFEQIGEFVALDEGSKSGKGIGLFRLNINRNMIQNDIKGIKPRAYELISKGLGIAGQYRTYDYYKAKTSSVYLEPIKLYTQLKEKIGDKPKQPEPPKQPKKGGQLERKERVLTRIDKGRGDVDEN